MPHNLGHCSLKIFETLQRESIDGYVLHSAASRQLDEQDLQHFCFTSCTPQMAVLKSMLAQISWSSQYSIQDIIKKGQYILRVFHSPYHLPFIIFRSKNGYLLGQLASQSPK